MEKVTLQNSNLNVSRLCMGGCPMGGYGWGNVEEKELIDAVHAAMDLGINFFDTADTYGLGQSEKTLGKALGTKRGDVVVATKFGVCVANGKTTYNNTPAYIRKALEDSLHRLGTDYVDIYQIHYRDETPLCEVVGELTRLKEEGKIRYFGLSNIHKEEKDEFLPYKELFVSMQDEYSLACRKNESDMKLLSDCLMTTPLTWGSLGQGILTGKYDINTTFQENDRRSRDIYVNFHGEKLKKNLEIVEKMKPIAKEHGVSVASVAIRFILDYLKDSVVLCGAKRPSQIISNAEADGWTLSREEIAALEEISRDSLA